MNWIKIHHLCYCIGTWQLIKRSVGGLGTCRLAALAWR